MDSMSDDQCDGLRMRRVGCRSDGLTEIESWQGSALKRLRGDHALSKVEWAGMTDRGRSRPLETTI